MRVIGRDIQQVIRSDGKQHEPEHYRRNQVRVIRYCSNKCNRKTRTSIALHNYYRSQYKKISGVPKKQPHKEICWFFLTSIEGYYIKILHTGNLSVSHKSGKIYCIMYRIGKTMLLLIMGVGSFEIIKKFSH